jgi:hypothetical protein
MQIEDEMEAPELRRELRIAWDRQFALRDAIRDLPDVPGHEALRALVDLGGSFPDMWEIGKTEQMKHPWGAVPAKTEYEIAQGLWVIIRDALRAHKASLHAQGMQLRENAEGG